MADDGYITIQRNVTTAEVEMFAELFRNEGIPARFHVMTGAQVGMGQQAFELRVDVPADSEARARELLGELEYVGSAEAADAAEAATGAAGDAAAATESTANPRRLLIAAGAAFVLPGGGHFYARRPWTGLTIAATLLCGWLTSFVFLVRQGGFDGEMLFGSLLALVFADSIGGVRAARAENRGIHATQAQQFARALVLMLIAAVAGAGFATAAATPRWLLARKLARSEVRCTSRLLQLTNRDRDGRVLSLYDLGVRVSRSGGMPTTFAIEDRGRTSREVIRPETTATFDVTLPEGLAETCRTDTCELTFSLTAGHPSDGSVPPLSGVGTCLPFWNQPDTFWPGRVEQAAAAE
jgi:hypothetical protein